MSSSTLVTRSSEGMSPLKLCRTHSRMIRIVSPAWNAKLQVLASLNHANIAHIYGLEDSHETRCIVMELVEGEPLAQRSKRGPLPASEALHLYEKQSGGSGQEQLLLKTDRNKGPLDWSPGLLKDATSSTRKQILKLATIQRSLDFTDV